MGRKVERQERKEAREGGKKKRKKGKKGNGKGKRKPEHPRARGRHRGTQREKVKVGENSPGICVKPQRSACTQGMKLGQITEGKIKRGRGFFCPWSVLTQVALTARKNHT